MCQVMNEDFIDLFWCVLRGFYDVIGCKAFSCGMAFPYVVRPVHASSDFVPSCKAQLPGLLTEC